MSISELLAYGKSKIHSDQCRLLLADLLNYSPLELYNYLDQEVSIEKEELFKKEINAIVEHKPLQYVLGHVNFYGLQFKVNPNVLIPRFETEELVENTIEYINRFFPQQTVDIIDLGTGSGVIGLTLKHKVPTANLTLLDISKEALSVAKENANNLNLEVKFIENDMLNNLDDKYDIIISNPPYIAITGEVEDIVKDNEPHLALFAGEKGLDCYINILKQVKERTKNKYLLAFEIGYDQKEDMINLINQYLDNVKIEVKKDLSGRNRMIFVFHNLV